MYTKFSTSLLQRCCAFSRSVPTLYNVVALGRTGSTRCFASGRFEKEKSKDIVLKSTHTEAMQRGFLVNWKAYKRSWKWILKTTKVFSVLWTFKEVHEGRERYVKKNHIIYYFRCKKDLDYWFVLTDEEGGGHSWAELTQGPNEMTAVFRGYLCQRYPAHFKPKNDLLSEKDQYFNGTVYLETKPFFTILDKREVMTLSCFNCIKIRLRGDGRRYTFEISEEIAPTERLVYFYYVHTRGGPLWEEVEIPYVKMLARGETSGKPVIRQSQLSPDMVQNFRFMLNDRIEGPFQLEIDYIALVNNPKYTSQNILDAWNPWDPINDKCL